MTATISLRGRSFIADDDFSQAEMLQVLDRAADALAAAQAGEPPGRRAFVCFGDGMRTLSDGDDRA